MFGSGSRVSQEIHQFAKLCTEQRTGAEEATQDGGMISGPLDLSYMGVYTIWMNSLGRDFDLYCYTLADPQ